MHFTHCVLFFMAFYCYVFHFVCRRVGVEEEMELQTFDSMHAVSDLNMSSKQRTREQEIVVFAHIYRIQCELVNATSSGNVSYDTACNSGCLLKGIKKKSIFSATLVLVW